MRKLLFTLLAALGLASCTNKAKDTNYMVMKMEVEGKDIIVIDPVYIVTDDHEWQKFIKEFDKSVFGFSDAIIAELSDYHQTELIDKEGNIIGEWCSDSNLLGCFLLDEVLQHSKKFAEDMDNWSNYCVIIRNFIGEVTFTSERRRFSLDFIKDGEYEEADVLIIKGIGSPSFESKYVSTEEFGG